MFNIKIPALVAALIIPVTVFSAQTTSPNSYVFTGKNLHINYDTTGLDGKPHFTYKSGNRILSFIGDQIRTVKTDDIGTVVSVTLAMTIDTGSTSLSVLVPRVNLGPTLKASIKSQGIVTKHKFSVIPSFNKGQLDNYTFVPLTGTAKFVVF